METDSITISNKAPESTALDFQALKKLGIEHIQSIAGKVWSDYNIHDPGVTMLEVLAYAITDISSRANGDIANIIASSSKEASNTFFTAAEILPNHPVTINDFRKVLIDLEPVRNAWLEIANEHELYIYLNKTTGDIDYNSGEKIDLRGLYNVLLEFNDVEIDTGNPAAPTKIVDINNSVLHHPSINISGTDIDIEIAFPYWDQMPEGWGTDITINEVTLENLSGQQLTPLGEGESEDYFAVLIVQYNSSDSHKIGIRIKVNTQDHGLPENDLQAGIIDALEFTAAEILADSTIIETSLIKEFNRRIIAALEIIQTVKTHLLNYRNLCEDFYAFRSIRVQEIAIQVELELYSSTKVEKALAQLFFEISQFLSPSISFYSLDEMLEKGYPVEQIFEGPLLDNGFIDDEELNDLKRADVIYTSDLVRIILGQNESLLQKFSNKIISVNNLTVSNYINNQALTTSVRNCLKLTQSDIYKPRLSIEKSQVRVFKSGSELEYDLDIVISEFQSLKQEKLASTTDLSLNTIEVPKGTELAIEDYYSIQNHFPLNYGIGEEGVPGLSEIKDAEGRHLRIAQAKQLKSYLIFFEQLFANYLSQLMHIGDLFSTNPNLINTYFSQPLYDIPNVAALLKDFTVSGVSWEDFKKNKENNYLAFLEMAINASDITEDRKNRFLDHLLGRFSEEFVEYSLLQAKQQDNIGLINDKSAFLQEYPLLSSERFKAFNYAKPKDPGPGVDVWDTNNVSGIQKRIAGKLGIKSYKRRNLFIAPSTYFNVVASGPDFLARLQDDDGTTIMDSINYGTNAQATAAIDDLITFGLHKKYYKVIKDNTTQKYQGHLHDDAENLLAVVEGQFDTRTEAYGAVDMVFGFMHEKFSGEGIYLVEHLLLRPKKKDIPGTSGSVTDKLLKGYPNGIDSYIEPYSFFVTVILPSGLTDTSPPSPTKPERFAEDDFKTFAEKLIRKELPAHIKADIYWLDSTRITAFENVYRIWLESTAEPTTSEEDLVTAQNDFMDQLNTIIANA